MSQPVFIKASLRAGSFSLKVVGLALRSETQIRTICLFESHSVQPKLLVGRFYLYVKAEHHIQPKGPAEHHIDPAEHHIDPAEHHIDLFYDLASLFNSYLYCKLNVISTRPMKFLMDTSL